jgi:membrane associated rhomboid family serine protease
VQSVTDVTHESFCYRHPDRPTGLSCAHCGRPICPACSIDSSVGQRCPECLRTEGAQRVIRARELTRRPSFASSPVTYGIIAVAGAIQLLAFVLPGVWNELFSAMAMWPPGVANGEWWRMITVILLHGGLIHVGFNMLITYQLGPQVERELGSWSFLTMFLATAAAGSAFAFFIGPDVPGVGASGAVFGLVGTWLGSALRRRETTAGRVVLRQLGGLLVLNAAVPFFIPNVAWEAHLGGLIAGVLIGWLWTAPAVRTNPVARVGVAAVVLVASIVSTQIF